MNICASCKHCVRLGLGTKRNNADYNIRCKGFDDQLVPCQDPVLGIEGYSYQNDLGGFVFRATIDKARPTCRSKNPMGECPRFEVKR